MRRILKSIDIVQISKIKHILNSNNSCPFCNVARIVKSGQRAEALQGGAGRDAAWTGYFPEGSRAVFLLDNIAAQVIEDKVFTKKLFCRTGQN